MSIKRTHEQLIEELIEEKGKTAHAEHRYCNAIKVINRLIDSLNEMSQQKYFSIPMTIRLIERLKERISEENTDEKENESSDCKAG